MECAVLTQGWDSALLQDVKGLPSLLQQDGQEHERLKEIGDNCHAGQSNGKTSGQQGSPQNGIWIEPQKKLGFAEVIELHLKG